MGRSVNSARPDGPREGPGPYRIYVLRAPRGRVARYVGVTYNPRLRWHMHVANALAARRGRRPLKSLFRWVLRLHDAGKRPVLAIVATVRSKTAALKREQETIARLREAGVRLLNEPRRYGWQRRTKKRLVAAAATHRARA